MKNKLFIITLLIFTICVLMTGCGNNKYKKPDIEAFGEEIYYHYHYVIDNRTGVVYLVCDYGTGSGITIMLNADGTPVLKSQLETEGGENNVE